MNKAEYFAELDQHISGALANPKRKYVFLDSEKIPCSPSEFIQHCLPHTAELRRCKACSGPRYEIIITLYRTPKNT